MVRKRGERKRPEPESYSPDKIHLTVSGPAGDRPIDPESLRSLAALVLDYVRKKMAGELSTAEGSKDRPADPPSTDTLAPGPALGPDGKAPPA